MGDLDLMKLVRETKLSVKDAVEIALLYQDLRRPKWKRLLFWLLGWSREPWSADL
jgi:hypothetical protein